MEITVGLKNLYAAFQESASDESLNEASRKLAARCCVLVAHINRVEGLARKLSENVMEVVNKRLAKFVEELGAELANLTKPAEGEMPSEDAPAIEGEPPTDAKPAAKPPVTTTPPAPMPPRGKMRSVKPTAPKVEPPDEETQMSVDSMLADADAEVRAIENASKAPLRTVPPTGGNAS